MTTKSRPSPSTRAISCYNACPWGKGRKRKDERRRKRSEGEDRIWRSDCDWPRWTAGNGRVWHHVDILDSRLFLSSAWLVLLARLSFFLPVFLPSLPAARARDVNEAVLDAHERHLAALEERLAQLRPLLDLVAQREGLIAEKVRGALSPPCVGYRVGKESGQ